MSNDIDWEGQWNKSVQFLPFSNSVLQTVLDICGTNIRCLDVGCGDGKLLQQLMQAGITNLYGVDISKTALKKAESRLSTSTNLYCIDLDNKDLSEVTGSFDLVIFNLSIAFLKKRREILTDIISRTNLLLLVTPVVIGDESLVSSKKQRISITWEEIFWLETICKEIQILDKIEDPRHPAYVILARGYSSP